MAERLTFQVAYIVRRANDLEGIAKKAAVLKRHGRVELLVGHPAERTLADIPPGGSSWHDYTTTLSTWQKLFPHPKMQPFLDMKHVARNRALLKDTLKIVRKHGYAAGMSMHTPFFLPEEFFAKYPEYRGAQCDHPRRTRREAFALCVDHPEVLAMYREMAAEMARVAPEVQWIKMMSNDAGAGLCWSDWLYPGVNGPSHCRHISTGARVKKLLAAITEGAGRPIDFVLNGNFSEAEQRELSEMIDERFHFEVHDSEKRDEHQVDVGSECENPVRGIFDPVGILKNLRRTRAPGVKRVGLAFRMNYSRGHELEDAAERVIEVVDAFFAEPAYGTVEQFHLLRKICEKWVGAKKRDELLEALVALHEAYVAKNHLTGRHLGNYMGVSTRHVNRPLVIMPQLLTAEEEAYFLPHVFNPHVHEARMDYRDLHGSKWFGGHRLWGEEKNWNPRIKALDQFRQSIRKVADVLDGMGGTPAGESLVRMGMSLRLYGCVIRSVNNFLNAGIVRDRNVEKLSGPAHLPPKIEDWTGDPDLQLLIGYMRDELDNTVEMIGLLEKGGVQQMLLAENAKEEDTFLLGPDLIGNLKKKTAIMRRHWTDAQSYMTIPHK